MPVRSPGGKRLDLLSVEEAMAEFHVGRNTLFRYIKAGRLKRYQRAMDRKTYIDRKEIRRLLQWRVVRGAR